MHGRNHGGTLPAETCLGEWDFGRYVLFDRWFTAARLVCDIVHQTGLRVIGW
jgi:hypothetical protein